MRDHVLHQMLTEVEAAQLLCCSKALLRKWRTQDEGPPFYRIGRLVRCSPSDLTNFIETTRVSSVGGTQ